MRIADRGNGVKYTELSVWQASLELAQSVFALTAAFPVEQRFVLASRMRRSALSIPSNIAEGHGWKSTAAFLNHLSIAAGSLRELETQIDLARRLGFVAPDAVHTGRANRQGWPYAVQADDFAEGEMMPGAQSAIRDPQSEHA